MLALAALVRGLRGGGHASVGVADLEEGALGPRARGWHRGVHAGAASAAAVSGPGSKRGCSAGLSHGTARKPPVFAGGHPYAASALASGGRRGVDRTLAARGRVSDFMAGSGPFRLADFWSAGPPVEARVPFPPRAGRVAKAATTAAGRPGWSAATSSRHLRQFGRPTRQDLAGLLFRTWIHGTLVDVVQARRGSHLPAGRAGARTCALFLAALAERVYWHVQSNRPLPPANRLRDGQLLGRGGGALARRTWSWGAGCLGDLPQVRPGHACLRGLCSGVPTTPSRCQQQRFDAEAGAAGSVQHHRPGQLQPRWPGYRISGYTGLWLVST